MRIYHAVCQLIEAKAHQLHQPEPEEERESDVGSQAESSGGHENNSLRIGFNRSLDDVFDDEPMEGR